jgi:cold shock CspA family protein
VTSGRAEGSPPPVAPGAVLVPGLLRSWTGSVVAFDVDAGIGEVATDDGEVFGFHCTAIAGGERVIGVGTGVVFSLRAFHRGELQATDLVRFAPLA